mmetsp:Transcript_63091/g.150389  ORF Transcript_63091/g.150389 Transcript_63091/m.150389 type:complete len:220 (+) Transcript_63091:571-1230(+)
MLRDDECHQLLLRRPSAYWLLEEDSKPNVDNDSQARDVVDDALPHADALHPMGRISPITHQHLICQQGHLEHVGHILHGWYYGHERTELHHNAQGYDKLQEVVIQILLGRKFRLRLQIGVVLTPSVGELLLDASVSLDHWNHCVQDNEENVDKHEDCQGFLQVLQALNVGGPRLDGWLQEGDVPKRPVVNKDLHDKQLCRSRLLALTFCPVILHISDLW